MSYTNRYGGGNYGNYAQGQRGGYSAGSNRAYFLNMKYANNQKPMRVTSGCKRVTKGDKSYLSAWKKTRNGFLSILVAESKKTDKKKGKNGEMYLTSMVIVITNKDTGVKSFHWGISDAKLTYCKVNGLGWAISTKNGGFVKTRNLK